MKYIDVCFLLFIFYHIRQIGIHIEFGHHFLITAKFVNDKVTKKKKYKKF